MDILSQLPGVKSLAELPPLPVMRATTVGSHSGACHQTVRTLAEPARQVAAVIKATRNRSSPCCW